MFKLSKYVRKEQLNEAFDNFGMLSTEVIERLKNYYAGRKYYSSIDANKFNLSHLGSTSEVKFVKFSKDVLDMIFSKYSPNSYEVSKNLGKIIAAVMRYKNEDLAILFPSSSGGEVSTEKLDDLENYNKDGDWGDRFQFTGIKSQSGFIKNVKSLITYLAKKQGTTAKEIQKFINFQLVYYRTPTERMKNKLPNSNNEKVTVNGVETLSNNYMGKKTMEYRLKAYLENKLPNITDPKKLPKDWTKFKDGLKIKFIGITFEYWGVNGDFKDLLKGDTTSFIFNGKIKIPNNYYDDFYLVFKIKLYGTELKVDSIAVSTKPYNMNDETSMSVDAFAKAYVSPQKNEILGKMIDNRYN